MLVTRCGLPEVDCLRGERLQMMRREFSSTISIVPITSISLPTGLSRAWKGLEGLSTTRATKEGPQESALVSVYRATYDENHYTRRARLSARLGLPEYHRSYCLTGVAYYPLYSYACLRPMGNSPSTSSLRPSRLTPPALEDVERAPILFCSPWLSLSGPVML
ncbi:hypothetical protein M8818_001505 [Zalaria obscura]|uniref:Uncharacterized protein n=1 Tax=Zalaria obscura TaxID=2024903 RepID=A0ACC3SJX6_9PEZI